MEDAERGVTLTIDSGTRAHLHLRLYSNQKVIGPSPLLAHAAGEAPPLSRASAPDPKPGPITAPLLSDDPSGPQQPGPSHNGAEGTEILLPGPPTREASLPDAPPHAPNDNGEFRVKVGGAQKEGQAQDDSRRQSDDREEEERPPAMGKQQAPTPPPPGSGKAPNREPVPVPETQLQGATRSAPFLSESGRLTPGGVPWRKLPKRPGVYDPRNVEVLSLDKPRAFLYHEFLTDEECDHMIEAAKPGLSQSGVVDTETGGSSISEIRTSKGSFLPRGMDDVIRGIERRIAEWSQIPEDHGEAMQVLKYDVSQEYRAHYDYFFHKQGEANNRIATVLLYLSDVEAGGAVPVARAPPSPLLASARPVALPRLAPTPCRLPRQARRCSPTLRRSPGEAATSRSAAWPAWR